MYHHHDIQGCCQHIGKWYINNLLWWPHEAHEPFELFHWKSPTKLLPHKGPGRALLDDSKDWNCLTLDWSKKRPSLLRFAADRNLMCQSQSGPLKNPLISHLKKNIVKQGSLQKSWPVKQQVTCREAEEVPMIRSYMAVRKACFFPSIESTNQPMTPKNRCVPDIQTKGWHV